MKNKTTTLLEDFVYENKNKITQDISKKKMNVEGLKEVVSYFKDNGLQFEYSSVIYSKERGTTEGFEFFYKEDETKKVLTLDSKKGVTIRSW
jgi:hypothetical protein